MTNLEMRFMETTPNKLENIKEELKGLRADINALTEAMGHIAEILSKKLG